MNNTEAQNMIISATAEAPAALYRADEERSSARLHARTEALLADMGRRLRDEDVAECGRRVRAATSAYAAECVKLGVLLAAKKKTLSPAEIAFGDWVTWVTRALGGTISRRSAFAYLAMARAFLRDAAAAGMEDAPALPPDKLDELIRAWCGERTAAQIARDLREEKEAAALDDAARSRAAETPEERRAAKENATAEARLAFNELLNRAVRRDEKLRETLEAAIEDCALGDGAARALAALAEHYGTLQANYARLAAFAAQREGGDAAGKDEASA